MATEETGGTIQINIPTIKASHLRWGSSGIYLAIFIAFLFTFIDLKCGETSLVKMKGTDLVLGKKMEESTSHALKDHDDFGKPLWPAQLALLAALAGAALIFIKGRKGRVLQICLSAVGALFIAGIKVAVDRQLGMLSDTSSGLSQGLIQVVYAPAYWLTLTLFLLNVCFNILLLFVREKLAVKTIAPDEKMSWEQDTEV